MGRLDRSPKEGTMTEDRAVVLRDTSSGRLHRATQTAGGRLRTDEGCNIDQAGEHEILDILPPDPDVVLLCRNCFTEPA